MDQARTSTAVRPVAAPVRLAVRRAAARLLARPRAVAGQATVRRLVAEPAVEEARHLVVETAVQAVVARRPVAGPAAQVVAARQPAAVGQAIQPMDQRAVRRVAGPLVGTLGQAQEVGVARELPERLVAAMRALAAPARLAEQPVAAVRVERAAARLVVVEPLAVAVRQLAVVLRAGPRAAAEYEVHLNNAGLISGTRIRAAFFLLGQRSSPTLNYFIRPGRVLNGAGGRSQLAADDSAAKMATLPSNVYAKIDIKWRAWIWRPGRPPPIGPPPSNVYVKI